MKKPILSSWSGGRTLLVISFGLNLVLGFFICSRYLSLDASTLNNAKDQYQSQLMNWQPYKKELDFEPLSGETPLPDNFAEMMPPSSLDNSSLPSIEEGNAPIEQNPSLELEGEDFDLLQPDLEAEAEDTQGSDVSEVSGSPVKMGFSTHPISDSLKETLEELAPIDPAVITYDQLRLVKVLYWGFDQQTHMGELIVHASVASEVQDIFSEIYNAKFPIEKIRLISEYDNSDEASMKDNNTSGFNYRPITNGEDWSLHAYGLAIDINPKINPYVSEDGVLPVNAMAYVDRDQSIPGMIQKGDVVYQAFTSRGWSWGGDWSSLKDYQHFSKSLN